MATVADIMTRDVLTLEPEMTLREAMETLTGGEVSGAPVVSGTRLEGVLSLTDLAQFLESGVGVPTQRDDQAEWGELETPASADEDLSENPSSFFVDFWANAGADVVARMAEPEGPEWDVLEEHTVSEVMTRSIVSVSPDDSVRDTARVMVDRDVHRVLVVRNGTLEGIVSSMDVVRAVAEGSTG